MGSSCPCWLDRRTDYTSQRCPRLVLLIHCNMSTAALILVVISHSQQCTQACNVIQIKSKLPQAINRLCGLHLQGVAGPAPKAIGLPAASFSQPLMQQVWRRVG